MGNYCAYLNNAEFSVNTPNGLQNAGIINQCLCGVNVDNFLQTTPVGINAVDLAGFSQAESDLNTLLLNYHTNDIAYCDWPAHTVSVCTPRNLCRWRCTDGYTASPLINPVGCICRSPKVECAGACQFASSCPSPAPGKKRKRKVRAEEDGGSRSGSGLEFQWWEGATCGGGYTPCGIFEGHNNGWDCVDAQNDLESCGGCAILLHDGSPPGKDCTTIPEVSDVVCMHGQCMVQRCRRGYQISSDGTSCERPLGYVLESH